MKNKEHYAEEISDLACSSQQFAVDKRTGKVVNCRGLECEDCLFNSEDFCVTAKKEWSEAEYKEPITRDRLAREYGNFVEADNISATKYHYSSCFEWLLENYNVSEKGVEDD